MKVGRQSIMYFLLPVFLLIGAGMVYAAVHWQVPHLDREATAGTLIIADQDLESGKPVRLNGQWEFYSGRLLTPEDFQTGLVVPKPDDYIDVPRSWKGHVSGGETLTAHGYATYRLKVHLPETDRPLGLAIHSITSAYRLWINGQLMDEKGTVGTDRQTTKPFKQPQLIPLELGSRQAEIIIQVSNFSQRKAGILGPIELGEYGRLEHMMVKKAAVSALMAGCILFTGLHHLVLFVRLRDRYASLWFGLICLFLGIKTMAEGAYLLAYFFPQLSNNVLVTLEYTGFVGGSPLFTLFVYSFFPGLMSPRVRNGLMTPGLCFLLIVLLTPVHIFTQLALPIQGYTVIVCLALLSYIFMAAFRRMEGAVLLATGAVFFFVTIINDMLFNNGAIQSGTYFSYGLLLMIICIEIILSLKLYNAYQTIEEMSRRMLQLDKLKDEFLANTSHELRTPLNGMIGLAQSLLFSLKGQLAPHHEQHLQMIVSSGQRLSYLINDILDYSRLSNNDIRINWTLVNLHRLIQVVFTVMQPLASGRKLRLNNNVSPNFPLILADENRLEQILFNLMGNAVKYTPQGQVTVGAHHCGTIVEIYVEDTGVGIPQDKFEDIFKPFEQLVDSQEGGTGLGLKITKQLVELHGGMIWVESEVDKGSRFIFTINQEKGRQEQKARKEETAFFPSVGKRHHPSATITKSSNTPNVHFHSQVFAVPALQENTATLLRSSDNGESPSEKTTEEGNSPYRVLIVDDEAVNLQVLMHQLGSLPCVIDPLGSGEEVLGMMEKLSHYDLIIVDIMLPGISGLELCREIRKRYSLDELPILMMTAGHRENTIAVAFNTGANDYISKPFDRVELVSRVKTLVLMKRAVQEVRHKAEELKKLNDQLTQLNLSLEERIQERTLELKEINEMLGMRNQELSRLEAARRRLLADISHELRTPMTAIQGYVEAIVSGLVDDSQEQERYLNTVLSKARSLNRLIQDLIELSRLESRRSDMIFEVIPLSDLVAQIKDRFALDVDQAGLVYRFQLQFDPALLDKYQVIIDMERIIQVLTNLVFNSIKYTDVGGEIRIICELDLEKTKEDVVGELVIHVEDTGCGIAPEALPYVFDRFYKDKTQNTNHGAPRGSGIGLAIAKEIVEYHNGSISVQSVVGEGTRFTFILPLYQLERITP